MHIHTLRLPGAMSCAMGTLIRAEEGTRGAGARLRRPTSVDGAHKKSLRRFIHGQIHGRFANLIESGRRRGVSFSGRCNSDGGSGGLPHHHTAGGTKGLIKTVADKAGS